MCFSFLNYTSLYILLVLTYIIFTARYISGELSLPSQGGTATNSNPRINASTGNESSQGPASSVVELKNMVTAQDLESDQDYGKP